MLVQVTEIDTGKCSKPKFMMHGKIDFGETKILFSRYKRKRIPKGKLNLKRRLADETSTRILQIEVLFNEILELLETEKEGGSTNIPSHKLWIHVEAFYYLCFRTCNLIKLLPGLETFKCKGIRDVRNKLIEHPQKDRPVYSYSFSWGSGAGPVIRPVRVSRDSGKFYDEGLFTNYLEFQENLCNLLNKALKNSKVK